MRVFVGTLLGASNQAFYLRLARELASRHGPVIRPVPDGSVHVTYVFMPDVPDGLLDLVHEAVVTAAADVQPSPMRLGLPRILWAGRTPRLVEAPVIAGAEVVTRLTKALSDAVGRHVPGIELSASKTPHVTVARFRKHLTRSDAQGLSRDLDCGERPDTIDRVSMIASVLTTSGPVYEIIRDVELNRAR